MGTVELERCGSLQPRASRAAKTPGIEAGERPIQLLLHALSDPENQRLAAEAPRPEGVRVMRGSRPALALQILMRRAYNRAHETPHSKGAAGSLEATGLRRAVGRWGRRRRRWLPIPR
jgi:hypothetical protein